MLFVMWTLPLPALFFLLVLFYFYFRYHLPVNKALKEGESNTSQTNTEPVSVVIAARNELPNLKANLSAILNQAYNSYEVVVINDHSYDGTSDYLKEIAAENPKLKVVTVETDERFKRGKKFALTMGIKAAKYNLLLFTDADCTPASNQWIDHMVRHNCDKEIILGFGQLQTRKSLLGLLVRFETVLSAINYFGYALRSQAYMGVGRNLMYRKDLFFKHKGFASHQHIISGDDDLFVQEAATKTNVGVCLHTDSFTLSPAPKSWSAWYNQKKRHHSTAKVYKRRFKRSLGLFSLSQVMFYAAVLTYVLLFPALWYYPATLVFLKWLVQALVHYKAAKQFGFKLYPLLLPISDICYTLYLVFFGFVYPFAKVKKWN